MINVPVIKPVVMETTAIGAAFAAGLAVGVWRDVDEIRELWSVSETFEPSMDDSERQHYWKGWQKAISKSIGWIENEDGDENNAVSADAEISTKEEILKVALSEPVVEAKPVHTSDVERWALVATGICAASVGFILGRARK